MSRAPLLRIGWQPLALPLASPVETAHGCIEERLGFLVRVEDAAGLVGYGEASPLPDFGTEDLGTCAQELRRLATALLRGRDATGDLETAISGLAGGAWGRAEPATPCARAALDSALHDLAARRAGLPLSEWLVQCAAAQPGTSPASGRWGPQPARSSVPVHALVAGRTPEEVWANASRACETGVRAFKLKVARGDGADGERVGALRDAIGPAALIRLDANGGWKTAEALSQLRALSRFDIEFVEQPCPGEDLDGLAWLRRTSPIRVAADEALLGGRALACLEHGVADVYVLKPAALGGLESARCVAEVALGAGADLVVTSFLDSAIGVAAALHFAAALPGRLAPCGIASAGFGNSGGGRSADLADLGRPSRGQLDVPRGAGLGIGPVAERLEAATRGRSESVSAWREGTRGGARSRGSRTVEEREHP